jgi:hypothetical protein
MLGMNPNVSDAPANIGRGITDDVDRALHTFLQHEIRVEATKAKQPVIPPVPTPTQSQGAGPSPVSNITSSGNTFGPVGSISQYAPGSISQSANGRQHLATASSPSMQSSVVAPQAQPILSNGRLSTAGRGYGGNMAASHTPQEEGFVLQSEPYPGFRARYPEPAPKAPSSLSPPQMSNRAMLLADRALQSLPSTCRPALGLNSPSQQMGNSASNPRMGPIHKPQQLPRPSLSPEFQTMLNDWEAYHFGKREAIERETKTAGCGR